MNASFSTKSGKISSPVSFNKVRTPDGRVEAISFFELESEFNVSAPGSNTPEIIRERSKVLLQGDEVCNNFSQAKTGDEVVLIGVVTYVKDGVLCLRAFNPAQIKLIPSSTSGGAGITFGLSPEDFVKAREYFRR